VAMLLTTFSLGGMAKCQLAVADAPNGLSFCPGGAHSSPCLRLLVSSLGISPRDSWSNVVQRSGRSPSSGWVAMGRLRAPCRFYFPLGPVDVGLAGRASSHSDSQRARHLVRDNRRHREYSNVNAAQPLYTSSLFLGAPLDCLGGPWRRHPAATRFTLLLVVESGDTDRRREILHRPKMLSVVGLLQIHRVAAPEFMVLFPCSCPSWLLICKPSPGTDRSFVF